MMERLPAEVVEIIAAYLTGPELANCCSVSRPWRDLFNQDVIWRRRCDRKLTEYLAVTECVVEPSFISPEVEGSGLSGVCEWRLHFMRQNHLYNNWRRGRHKKCEFYSDTGSKYIFYRNDFALTKGVDEFYLWSVINQPIISATCPLPKYTLDNETFQVLGDKVIVSMGNLVAVFKISLEPIGLQLEYTFSFDKEEKGTDPLHRNETTDCASTILVSETLLGMFADESPNNRLHIWNVSTGKKISEEVCPSWSFFKIYGGASTDRAVIVTLRQSNPRLLFQVTLYDVKKLAFTSFTVTQDNCPYRCTLHSQFVGITTAYSSNLYSRETSEHVIRVPSHYVEFHENIVYSENSQLKQFLPLSGKVETLIKHVKVYNLKVIGGIFIALTTQDIPKKSMLYMINSDGTKLVWSSPFIVLHSIVNQSCTKVLSINSNHHYETEVYHFW